MPGGTVIEESNYSLPSEKLFDGELSSVTVRNIKGDGKNGPFDFDIWVWEFKVTDGEYKGQKAWGETESKVTTADAQRGRTKLVRPWAETLLGRSLHVGENFHTDQILGLPCKFTVAHDEPRQKKDGGWFYGCPVDDVFPATGAPEFIPY
jgi:hypothetical protein